MLVRVYLLKQSANETLERTTLGPDKSITSREKEPEGVAPFLFRPREER